MWACNVQECKYLTKSAHRACARKLFWCSLRIQYQPLYCKLLHSVDLSILNTELSVFRDHLNTSILTSDFQKLTI